MTGITRVSTPQASLGKESIFSDLNKMELQGRYIITSNRESGFGRYDVMLEPKNPALDDAILLEFKVYDAEDEEGLKDTVQAALRQIEEKQYAAGLIARGIEKSHIRSYGFAFQGKGVLIGKGHL